MIIFWRNDPTGLFKDQDMVKLISGGKTYHGYKEENGEDWYATSEGDILGIADYQLAQQVLQDIDPHTQTKKPGPWVITDSNYASGGKISPPPKMADMPLLAYDAGETVIPLKPVSQEVLGFKFKKFDGVAEPKVKPDPAIVDVKAFKFLPSDGKIPEKKFDIEQFEAGASPKPGKKPVKDVSPYEVTYDPGGEEMMVIEISDEFLEDVGPEAAIKAYTDWDLDDPNVKCEWERDYVNGIWKCAVIKTTPPKHTMKTTFKLF